MPRVSPFTGGFRVETLAFPRRSLQRLTAKFRCADQGRMISPQRKQFLGWIIHCYWNLPKAGKMKSMPKKKHIREPQSRDDKGIHKLHTGQWHPGSHLAEEDSSPSDLLIPISSNIYSQRQPLLIWLLGLHGLPHLQRGQTARVWIQNAFAGNTSDGLLWE